MRTFLNWPIAGLAALALCNTANANTIRPAQAVPSASKAQSAVKPSALPHRASEKAEDASQLLFLGLLLPLAIGVTAAVAVATVASSSSDSNG